MRPRRIPAPRRLIQIAPCSWHVPFMVSVPHLKADFALRLNQPTAVFACPPAVLSAVSSPVPPLFSRIRKIADKHLISIEKLIRRIGDNSGGKKFRRVTGDNS